jgi:hypothetical protein
VRPAAIHRVRTFFRSFDPKTFELRVRTLRPVGFGSGTLQGTAQKDS